MAVGEVSDARGDRLLRIKQVLVRIPVSKSTWWAGVKTGRFPAPVRLGKRVTCWRESDILALMRRKE
jgi:prophage regulatory protein